ncbi:hypothetical protein KIH74_22970 [Kineosporia sp. J2-2]|uniref:Terminase n=1 Tax=Kineosporia corallincola TaxID=2835133 RepID=A0ABS5TL44_9ACTN|nr:hypothetical protein [Kineosporia corallincola]MBT0771822.1 hypothetical protein [Kineosporia corallincola]
MDWLTENLARPELDDYQPFVPTREQAEFILRFYELDPLTGKRKIRRGVISRPRGWGKSPFTAAMACLEGLGPVQFGGWDADGRPVGEPWSRTRRPLVEIAAVSESQVDTNTWAPLLDMLTRGPVLENYPGVEPLGTFINLPFGRIQKRTAAAGSAKGAPAVFVVCDQTEEWTPGNGGKNLFNKLKNNVIKRGGHLLESPNAYTPGMDSVAESSMQAYMAIRSGKARIDDGLMFDHREAPAATDMADGDSLIAGLAVAYGDSADVESCAIHNPSCHRPGWVDLDHIRSSIWEPDADPQVSRSDWLNQVTHAADSWLSQPEWAACTDAAKVLADKEAITLGFDGSVRDDASALVACRISDGHLTLLECWEKPNHAPENWQVDREAVDYAVAAAFERYTVLGFYCDPALWQDYVDRWTHQYGERLKVRASQHRPMEWWTNRPVAMVAALERFHTAVLAQSLSHDGNGILASHVLNARRRPSRAGITISKEHPKSQRKIDAAMAATLAYECRSDAIAAGVQPTKPTFYVPRKIY